MPINRFNVPPRRLALVLLGVVAVAGAGLVAWRAAASGGATTAYRTARAERASVTDTLTRTGTIEPISQAAVAFPTAGTVASVAVAVGDTVVTGQTLATLDTTTRQSQLAQKQAALAGSRLTLDRALAAAATAAATPATTAPPAVSAAVQTAGRRVDTAQGDAVDAVAAAHASVNASGAVCASGDQALCTAAQRQTMADQRSASAAQANLASAQGDLSAELAAGSAGPAARAVAGPSSPASSFSAEQLVANQAAIDAAAAEVAVVQQDLAQATIVSPIAGTVAVATLTVGRTVAAGSDTAHVVIVGQGGFEVTTTVPVASITKVKAGAKATVTPDGSPQRIEGTVVAVSVAPTTSGTTTVYAVAVGLTGGASELHNGSTAVVAIQVATVDAAVTVPTSAVHSAGGLHVVTTLTVGRPAPTPVQVGTVGPERTEITAGLALGQEVVLAEPGLPLPASNNASGAGRLGGPGGLRGGLGGTRD
ncbi:MAG: HlyD family efflux transporter periplasmic adaptor subunit [Acidimicrobiales bacterium]